MYRGFRSPFWEMSLTVRCADAKHVARYHDLELHQQWMNIIENKVPTHGHRFFLLPFGWWQEIVRNSFLVPCFHLRAPNEPHHFALHWSDKHNDCNLFPQVHVGPGKARVVKTSGAMMSDKHGVTMPVSHPALNNWTCLLLFCGAPCNFRLVRLPYAASTQSRLPRQSFAKL